VRSPRDRHKAAARIGARRQRVIRDAHHGACATPPAYINRANQVDRAQPHTHTLRTHLTITTMLAARLRTLRPRVPAARTFTTSLAARNEKEAAKGAAEGVAKKVSARARHASCSAPR
jgi:hypothetical protein